MMLLPIYFIQTDFRKGAFSMDEKQVGEFLRMKSTRAICLWEKLTQ